MAFEHSDKSEEFYEQKVFESSDSNEHSMSDANEIDEAVDLDDENYSDDQDNDFDVDIVQTGTSEILMPPCRSISEVNALQKQQVICQYFNMTYDYCDTKFQEFEDANRHYKEEHRDQPEGYIKCCAMTFKVRKKFNDHIVWHLNPDAFK